MGFNTTVGQLNFFEWAINDEILEYIEKHHDQIHQDMETRIKDTEPEKTHKRHELSKSATNSIKCHDVKITVKFD